MSLSYEQLKAIWLRYEGTWRELMRRIADAEEDE